MSSKETIITIQAALGAKTDGIWGPKSQAALDELVRPGEVVHTGKASSFADPKDVEAFRRCKAKGKSDNECFKVGDNGIGCWGDDTTGATPCCALSTADIVRRWGSLTAGKNKLVEVTANDTRVICVLKDIKGQMNEAIIDLNPGACEALGLTPPIMVSCTWKWVS